MITVDSHVYDVGTDHGSIEELAYDIISRTQSSWDNGADIVIFPEYIWLNAVQYKGDDPEDVYTHKELAEQFWGSTIELLKNELSREEKMVILGSAPKIHNETLVNSAPILFDNEFLIQEKLALTPWEFEYKGGKALNIFTFKGKKCAVLICLDIEMPELAIILKREKVDLVLVPSATEGVMGVERIARCASARSVEVGAVVVVSALCGEVLEDEFVGSNIGRSSMYVPSLTGLETDDREQEGELHRIGTTVARFEIDSFTFDVARHETQTTNPANIAVEHDIKIIKGGA